MTTKTSRQEQPNNATRIFAEHLERFWPQPNIENIPRIDPIQSEAMEELIDEALKQVQKGTHKRTRLKS